MSDQPTALRLAEKLGDYGGCTLAQMDAAAAELRRLHALNAELVEALRAASNYIDVLGGDSKRYRAALAKVKE